MAAIWSRVRSEVRRRVAGTVLLILFLGVASGAVLGALAGARRTDTAYLRMLEATGTGDVLVSVEETGLTGFYGDLSRLPEVEALGAAVGLDLFVTEGPEHLLSDGGEFLPGLAAVDDQLLHRVSGPRITAGRLPRPDRPDEVFANRFLAGEGLEVGTTLEVRPGRTENPAENLGPTRRVTVVGTGIFANEVLPIAVNDSFPVMVFTRAFYEQWVGPEFVAFDGAFVRLRPGTDVSDFRGVVEDVLSRHPEAGGMFFAAEEQRTEIVQRAVRPQVIALQLFAALTAATTALLFGQALSRQLYGDASDYPTMRALGMTRRQLMTVGMIRTGIVAVGGAAVAVAMAAATSPMMPLGTARIAEPDPGFEANVALLGLGGLAIVAVVMLVLAPPAYLRARAVGVVGAVDQAAGGKPSRLASVLARSGAPSSLMTGVRMAMDPGRGRTSAPVRSAMVGTILAIVALTATVTFASSLDRLVETPRLYGQNWDATVDAGFGTVPRRPAVDRLAMLPEVEAFSGGVVGEIEIEGRPVAAIGIDALEGSVTLTIVEGRTPRSDEEIVLGTRTLRNLRRRVGEQVRVSSGIGERPMTIVGRAVFPQFGLGSFTPTGLGDGALTVADALVPPVGPDVDGYNVFLIRFRRDAPNDAADRAFRAAVAGIPDCDAGFCGNTRDLRPGDVTNYARVRSTPLVLAALLTLLAVAAIGHALITSVRRRARELAVLKTIGFLRRQVYATVAWQASTLAVVSLLIGIPAGIAAGRAVWIGFADRLGIPPEPIVPLSTVAIGIAATVVIANVAAALPGARAARLRPAVVLRDE